MRPGKYKPGVRTSWHLRPYQTLSFTPTLFCHAANVRGTCGTSAIATLTGVHPATVAKSLPSGYQHWPDKLLFKYLRSRGFQFTELTRCGLTANSKRSEYPIQPHHVLLISQWMIRNEGTWVIVHRNKLYHNGEEEDLSPLEFVNKPIWTAHMVWHNDWVSGQNKLAEMRKMFYVAGLSAYRKGNRR